MNNYGLSAEDIKKLQHTASLGKEAAERLKEYHNKIRKGVENFLKLRKEMRIWTYHQK